MYAVVRHYENAKALTDVMASRAQEVNDVISAIPGFISYLATRDGEAMTSITICESKDACDESNKVAREWVKANITAAIGAPVVNGGDVFISFSK